LTVRSRCCRWPRDARAAHARLCPPRHHHAVCGAGRGHRQGHRRDHRRHRSSEFVKFLRTIEANVREVLDIHHRDGQLRHAQDRHHQTLAGRATAVPCPLHADVRLVAEPGRALVLDAYRAPHPPRARIAPRGSSSKQSAPTSTSVQ